MDQQPAFRDRVRRSRPQLRRALCALLISAIAAVPLAHATDLGMAPQAAFYVTVPFQPEKAAMPEFGLRISQETVVAGDPGFAVRRAPMLDFRLRAERETAALTLNGVALNATEKGGMSSDTKMWLIIGIAVGVAAILIIQNHDNCDPTPTHPC